MPADDFPEEPQILAFSVLQERRRERGKCDHRSFQIDPDAGAVFCRDCGEEVPAFQALRIVAREDSILHARYRALRESTVALKAYKPWLRAVKRLEEIWRGRRHLPMCPHCQRGIKAEDLARTGIVSAGYDAAKAETASKRSLKVVQSEDDR